MVAPPASGPRRSAWRTALQISAFYFAFATLWIIGSSLIAAALADTEYWLQWIELAKGMLFIAITSTLLCLVSARLIGALTGAHEEADRERRLLRTVLGALPVGVFIADADGRIVQANDQAERIWGGPAPLPSDVEGYAAYKAWWADSGRPIAPEEWAMARALRRGEASLGEVIDIERFDGTRRTILNSAAPVRDADGRVVGAVVAIEDITELRQAQAALRERTRLEGALLAARTALHHLSNELALTVGYAELLADDPRLPPDLREPAAEALRGAAEATATLQRLQRVTRLEEIDFGAPSGPVIDLDRSVGTEE